MKEFTDGLVCGDVVIVASGEHAGAVGIIDDFDGPDDSRVVVYLNGNSIIFADPYVVILRSKLRKASLYLCLLLSRDIQRRVDQAQPKTKFTGAS